MPSLLSDLAETPSSLSFAVNIGTFPPSAFAISSSAFEIPSLTCVTITFLPLKRSIGTFVSAATIMQSASAISDSVRTFFAPPEPLVSTLIAQPAFSAAF